MRKKLSQLVLMFAVMLSLCSTSFAVDVELTLDNPKFVNGDYISYTTKGGEHGTGTVIEGLKIKKLYHCRYNSLALRYGWKTYDIGDVLISTGYTDGSGTVYEPYSREVSSGYVMLRGSGSCDALYDSDSEDFYEIKRIDLGVPASCGTCGRIYTRPSDCDIYTGREVKTYGVLDVKVKQNDAYLEYDGKYFPLSNLSYYTTEPKITRIIVDTQRLTYDPYDYTKIKDIDLTGDGLSVNGIVGEVSHALTVPNFKDDIAVLCYKHKYLTTSTTCGHPRITWDIDAKPATGLSEVEKKVISLTELDAKNIVIDLNINDLAVDLDETSVAISAGGSVNLYNCSITKKVDDSVAGKSYRQELDLQAINSKNIKIMSGTLVEKAEFSTLGETDGYPYPSVYSTDPGSTVKKISGYGETTTIITSKKDPIVPPTTDPDPAPPTTDPTPTPGGGVTIDPELMDKFIKDLADALKEALKGITINGGSSGGGGNINIDVSGGDGGTGGSGESGAPGGSGGNAGNVSWTVDLSKFPWKELAQELGKEMNKVTNLTVSYQTMIDVLEKNKFSEKLMASLVQSGFTDQFVSQIVTSTLTSDIAKHLSAEMDFCGPSIQVTRRTVNSSKSSITLNVECLDTDSHGLASPPISFNGGSYKGSVSGNKGSASETFTENGMVTISARDKKGNISSMNVFITELDTENPKITGLSKNTSEWTNQPVTIAIEAEDDQGPCTYSYSVKFNDGTTGGGNQGNNNKFTIPKNGVVTITVTDPSGHTTTTPPIIIDNIDTTPPSAKVEFAIKDNEYTTADKGVVATVTVIDTLDPTTGVSSGIPTNAIMWEAVNSSSSATNGSWSASKTFTYKDNNTHYIRVRDNAGNVSDLIPVTVPHNAIQTVAPVVQGLAPLNGQVGADGKTYYNTPVTMQVTASAGSGGRPLADKPYSWDGGYSWTTFNTKEVFANGDVTVHVKDKAGNVSSLNYPLSTVDSKKPEGTLMLYRGLPETWPDGKAYTTADYVWKIEITADDTESGIRQIRTLWDNQTYDATVTSESDDIHPYTRGSAIRVDVLEPGTYGVEIYDMVGNMTYLERVVEGDSVGLKTGVSSNNVQIKNPAEGSAGEYYGTNLTDLVFSNLGAYNTATGSFKPYPTEAQGIPVLVSVTPTYDNYLTGTATFDNVTYTLKFYDAASGSSTTAVTPYKSDGREVIAYTLIPATAINKDLKNSKVNVVIKEWRNSGCTNLAKEGSGTLYVSTQYTKPTVTWTWNEETDIFTVTGTSTVAQISSIEVIKDGTLQKFDGPGPHTFTVGDTSEIDIKVTDNCGNSTTLLLDGHNLPLSGNAGGILPTENINDPQNVQSYHVSNRSADIYIIGGTRSNTQSVPSGNTFTNAGL